MNRKVSKYIYCGICGRPFPVYGNTGRAPKYCSDVCRHVACRIQDRESKQRRSFAKQRRQKKRSNQITFTEWAMASKALGLSYGELRHRYESGEITKYELKKAVALRIKQIG